LEAASFLPGILKEEKGKKNMATREGSNLIVM
jgi:hypothetical protein